MKKVLMILLFIVLVPLKAEAQIGGGRVAIYDNHDDWYSVLELARDILQTYYQLEDLVDDQITHSLDGAKYLAHYQNLIPIIEGITSRLETGEALTYSMSDIGGRFNSTFEGFRPSGDYLTDFDNWTKVTLDTLRGTLDATALQHEHVNAEQAFLSAIEDYNANAIGRDQLLQSGNMFLSYQTKELSKLRELMMAQLNAQNIYMSNEVNQKAESLAKTGEWLTGSATNQVPRYTPNDGRGFTTSDFLRR